MNKQRLKQQLSSIALSLFRKEFFGIYHGSLSAKTESNKFIINTKNAVFDLLNDNNLIELYFQKDYRWNEASIDADIHQNIYSHISDAKFISFTMPIFTMAYALTNDVIIPKDYFGYKEFSKIKVYDPKSFDDWYDRANTEIAQYFQMYQTDIMVIRGYGVYSFNRDIDTMIKKLAILEKSAKILINSK